MNVIKVSQVNTYIKALLDESTPLKNIYISGEISNFTHYFRSGHFYFTLKDENSQLKAVMFSTNASKLKFIPENGMKVICRGKVAVYEKAGEYQLYVSDIQPDGLGALNLSFEQLKEKLFSEGVCDESKKKAIPKFPKKIGVATSNTGAAIEDIKNITKRRCPLFELVIVPTIVQGEKAVDDIISSIELLDSLNDIDVIILGRGGGSIEDLWAFNSEKVARAIISCKTPIISAVGHESDFTIADFVADLRASTPSAAAELVCPDINVLKNDLNFLTNRLYDSINSSLDEKFMNLYNIADNPVLSDYESVLNVFKNKLDNLSYELKNKYNNNIEKKELKFYALTGKLDALSPLSVISRGYSLIYKNNHVVKDDSEIKVDDKISILTNKSKFNCTVNEVFTNER